MDTSLTAPTYATDLPGRPLRIAIVTENFLPNVDGVTRTLARLLATLRAEGHEALVLGPESGMTSYEGHEVCGTKGIPLYFYPGLKEFDPDVIHYVDPIWLSAQAQPLIEYAFPDTAAVSSYHTNLARYAGVYGFHWLTSTMWQLQRRLHGHCIATFCPSPSTRSMLHGEGFDNVRLWPRGVDTSLFNATRRSCALRSSWNVGLKEKPKVVLSYVGRISHEKNIGLLIEAFEGLEVAAKALDPTFPGCKLILVGDGPARVELEKACSSQNPDVIFMGYRKGTELAECYASSDVFAFPSHSETFGNVVLEALASGLPAVGLHAEGVCDLVEHGKTGYLLDLAALPGAVVGQKSGGVPSNTQELLTRGTSTFATAVLQYRALLLRLIINRTSREYMSSQALAYAGTRTWSEAMGCLIRGYQEAAALTHRRKSVKLLSSLSRTSGTSSLASSRSSYIDVLVEEPPIRDETEEDALSSGNSSARLMFGRPPLKALLRRSTRTEIRESISLKWRESKIGREYSVIAREPASMAASKWNIVFVVVLLIILLWTASQSINQFVNESLELEIPSSAV